MVTVGRHLPSRIIRGGPANPNPNPKPKPKPNPNPNHNHNHNPNPNPNPNLPSCIIRGGSATQPLGGTNSRSGGTATLGPRSLGLGLGLGLEHFFELGLGLEEVFVFDSKG